MTPRTLIAALALVLAVPVTAAEAVTGGAPSRDARSMAVPAAVRATDFLTPNQVRARLDLSRPLTSYQLDPTTENPEPDPDCGYNVPQATYAKPYPAARVRAQSFDYVVPGTTWNLTGGVLVFEYSSAARARAAYRRVVASVRSATRYALVCEAINPIVTGQSPTRALAVPGTSFAWRFHLRSGRAGAYREVVSTRGNRLVWVELGREFRRELDWGRGTPPPVFPRYPSEAYLQRLAQAAIAKGF